MGENSHTGIEFELQRMSVSSWVADLAADSSHSPVFFLDRLSPSPPPLCTCDSDPCTCSYLGQQNTTVIASEDVYPCIGGSIRFEQPVHNGRACQCPCHGAARDDVDHLLRRSVLVIFSVIAELQHTTPYGALSSEVHDRVLDVIKLTPLEYKEALHWLLEEYYVVSPLGDGRLQVTQCNSL
ncbi:hypothetical protein C8R48DRAFT_781320 [Suillus tomentosus]|nr:hypothetical protein C8R48DRAFT_781320 [Suillus tomentosus]